MVTELSTNKPTHTLSPDHPGLYKSRDTLELLCAEHDLGVCLQVCAELAGDAAGDRLWIATAVRVRVVNSDGKTLSSCVHVA